MVPVSDPNVSYRQISELSDLAVTGQLSLRGTGKIVTSTDTGAGRVVLTSTAADRILFPTGSTKETGVAYVVPVGSPTPGSFLSLTIVGPSSSVAAGPSIRLGTDFLEIASSDIRTNGPVSPYTNNTYDLGTTDYGWRNLYLTGDILTTAGAPIIDASRIIGLTTWNPTITTTGSTGPGGQTVTGYYTQNGPLVTAWGTVLFTSNSTNLGTAGSYYRITPPKKMASDVAAAALAVIPVGSGFLHDKSADDIYPIIPVAYTTDRIIFRYGNAGTTEIGVVNSTNPFTFSTADRLNLTLNYPTTE